MPSKSNTISLNPQGSPLMISVVVHASLFVIVVAAYYSRFFKQTKSVDFEVIEHLIQAPKALDITPVKNETKPIVTQRKIFGLSRKALIAESAKSDTGVTVKQGNTLATAPDNEKLKPSDADSLPIPTDEFLVTAMPSLLSEVRINYPPAARSRGVEGPVVMMLLIDGLGQVREVQLVSGPDPSLSQAAVDAAKGFRFKPAMVEAKAVAVRIRYTYRFVLER